MVNYDELLDALVSLRKQSGDSQQTIAAYLDVHQTTISSIERRRTHMTVEIALAWAERYGRELTLTTPAATPDLDRLVVAAAALEPEHLASLLDVVERWGSVHRSVHDIVRQLLALSVSEAASQSA